MKNISKIVWSAQAIESFEKIIAYLKENWTEKEIKKFIKILENQISIIKDHPLSFPKSQFVQIRKSVLSKHITLYYKIVEDVVYIVTIFDNRQSPEKINLEKPFGNK